MNEKLHYLRRLSDWTNNVVQVLTIVLLIVMLSLSLVAIFALIITGEPVTWGTSLTRLFLPWVALLSISVTLKMREHIGLTLFMNCLPPRYHNMVAVINRIILGLLGVALMWYGTEFFLTSTQMLMITDTLQLSYRWTAVVVPLAGVIVTIHVLGEKDLVPLDNTVDQFELEK